MHNHSHPAAQERSREAIRVTWIGAAVDFALVIAKIVIGWLFFSHALIADGIHSLSDLLTDFMVVAIVKVSSAAPDAEHPYGHERFETLGTAFLGLLLVAIASAMAYESSLSLFEGGHVNPPGWQTLVVAVLSIIGKEWQFRFTRAAGKRLGSELLVANAWHSRSDAFSSIVVFFGIGGTMLGLTWLDSLAALGVAIFIAKIGWDLSMKALRELVDTAIEPDELAALTDAAITVEGITDVHNVKSRRMGSKILLELHLQVAPYLSTSESHYIGDRVVAKLMKEFDSIGHIIFHIDIEHDDDISDELQLPLRSEATEAIEQALKEVGIGKLKPNQLTLHYVKNQIEIELFLDGNEFTPAQRQNLNTALDRMRDQFNWCKQIRLWYSD